jgi:lysozyme
MTDILSDLIEGFEGRRLFVYDDATGLPLKTGDTIKGTPTIGVGRSLSTHGISNAEADLLKANDLALVREAVAHALPWVTGMSATRQAVIQCMAFQLGISGLLGFHMLLTFCQQARYKDAAAAGRQSLWHDQTPARAEKLMQLLEAG